MKANRNPPTGLTTVRKGRGSPLNPPNRYEKLAVTQEDDGWGILADEPQRIPTELIRDSTRSIINYVQSPDLPFDRTINVYRGCEHGCVYCYARPSHAYLGFSPGLDFETKIVYKENCAQLLRAELNAPKYRCAPLALGSNTDPYQQSERQLRLTRAVLEVLCEARHPLSIVTKSGLVARDLDILQEMAQDDLVCVFLSITTLNPGLVRRMEPRAAAPAKRLETLTKLAQAGIPTGVMVAPIIPFINDAEMEMIMQKASAAGARTIGYVFLRLPLELKEIFTTWLEQHYPLVAQRVLARIRDSRGGELYDSAFGKRMRGQGPFADLIAARFRRQRAALNLAGLPKLNRHLFRRPAMPGQQSLL